MTLSGATIQGQERINVKESDSMCEREREYVKERV